MVMGIVICMAKKRKCTYPQCSNYIQSDGLCIQHGHRKKTCCNNGCTNNAIRNGVCISHGAKRYCTILGCIKLLFQARKCRSHFWCLLLATEDILAAANAMAGMCHDASATTSGSVVGGQKIISSIMTPQSWTLLV
jgi:hypothetical protein